jgi:hypothetical protein
MRRLTWVGAAVLLASCGGGAPEVSDSTFVAAMSRLQAIDRDTLLDSAGQAAARGKVLQEEGLTAEALVHAARRLADDPQRARQLFISIDHRVDSMTTDPVP